MMNIWNYNSINQITVNVRTKNIHEINRSLNIKQINFNQKLTKFLLQVWGIFSENLHKTKLGYRIFKFNSSSKFI